jgi:electron transfer flavoprotein alpha subunit
MLRVRSSICFRAFVRAYATSPSPHALVFLEHQHGVIESGSLSALTAAQQLGGKVTGLIVGGPEQVPSAVESARKYVWNLS